MDKFILMAGGSVCGWIIGAAAVALVCVVICFFAIAGDNYKATTHIGLAGGATIQTTLYALAATGAYFLTSALVNRHHFYRDDLFFYIPLGVFSVLGFVLTCAKINDFIVINMRIDINDVNPPKN